MGHWGPPFEEMTMSKTYRHCNDREAVKARDTARWFEITERQLEDEVRSHPAPDAAYMRSRQRLNQFRRGEHLSPEWPR
jgi:hypothetical protein